MVGSPNIDHLFGNSTADCRPTSIIYHGMTLRSDMSRDPLSLFGPLMLVCISDEYVKNDKGLVRDGVLFAVLGIASSVLTTYLLSVLGLLV